MTALLGIELPKIFYSAGEAVKGSVVFQPKADRKVWNIQLHFTGFEFVENSLLSDNPFQKRWVLTGQTTLFGKKPPQGFKDEDKARLTEENDSTTIKEGKYTWPFSFTIPSKIPPSAEFKNGRIKIEYNLVALVEIPWSKGIRCVQTIRVGMPFVIDPMELIPPTIEEKHFLIHSHAGTNEAQKHTLKITASIDKPVTYSGDKINVRMKVQNNSGKTIQGIRLKMKQQWVWGSSNTEKITIHKVNVKDKAFPLEQTTWEGQTQIIVPNLDLKPTIENANLIKCHYHITIRVIVKGVGLDLLCKLPFTVASFKPLVKGVDDVKKEEKKDEKKDVKQAEVPLINLMDIDVPAPAALPAPVVGPSANPFGEQPVVTNTDMFANVVPSQSSLQNMDYSKVQNDIKQNVHDIDTAVSWTVTGHLVEAVDVPKGTTIESAQNELVNVAKELFQGAADIAAQAKALKAQETVDAAKKLSVAVAKFTDRSKISSTQVPDPATQAEILNKAKSVLNACLDTVSAGKDVTIPDVSADRSQEQALQALNSSIKSIGERLQELLKFSQQSLAASHKRIQDLVETKASLVDAATKFNNPFDAPSNDAATLDDVRKAASEYKRIASQFVTNVHGSQQSIVDQAKQLTAVTKTLLANITGVSKQNPELGKKLKDEGKLLAQYAGDLLSAGTIELKQGHAHKEMADADLNAQKHAQAVIELTTAKPATPLPPAKDIEKGAADELEKAVQAMLKATEVLQRVKKAMPAEIQNRDANPFGVQNVDHKWEVIGSTNSLTEAIRELMIAAAAAQNARADWAKTASTDVYHQDETWIDGLISAAKQVVIHVNRLVELAQTDEWEETEVISITKQIGAAIAQLVSAQKAKGDPKTEEHKRLLRAAKVVTQAIEDVVKNANECKHHNHGTDEDLTSSHATDYKIKEFQRLNKIMELERMLNNERQNLASLRKGQYTGPSQTNLTQTQTTPKQGRKDQQ